MCSASVRFLDIEPPPLALLVESEPGNTVRSERRSNDGGTKKGLMIIGKRFGFRARNMSALRDERQSHSLEGKGRWNPPDWAAKPPM